MDTKQLYINSQKTVLNWGVGFAAFLFLLTIVSLFAKGHAVSAVSLWVSSIAYTIIFTGMIITRLRTNKNAAFATLLLYAAFSVYSLIEMIIKFKVSAAFLKDNAAVSVGTLIFGYAVGMIVLAGVNFLFYNVYKATKNILILDPVESI